LLGYHLPLDCHPVIGNNAAAARALRLKKIRPFGEYNGIKIGFSGEYHAALPRKEVFKRIYAVYHSRGLLLDYGAEFIKSIGIVSGGGASIIKDAVEHNLDLFITGEPAESVVQTAKEESINFAAVGHYASERLGIQALTRFLNKNLKVKAEFVDIPVPV
ncbi:MAG: Nif3-like dinuclear metal center hexameric protein, partial [bacterium]